MTQDTHAENAPPGSGAGPGPGAGAGAKGLKGGALGLVASVVIGMSSTAPAYSLAATLGFIVVAVGVKAPAVILLAFIPMYLIALAYQELNRAEPDCGTTFTWASRAFGPWVGWLGGWGIIAADVIVMANLAQIAGSYSYKLVGADGLADSTFWTTVAGVLWIAIMTYICYRGVEVSARMQYALLGIELVLLLAFAAIALVKVWSGNGVDGSVQPALSWFWPGGLGVSDLVAATLLAVFIYWGWDTAVACNEETADPEKTPGRAAILSTVLLLVTYGLVAVAAVAFAGTGTTGIGLGNPANGDDIFNALGPAVFGDSLIGQGFEILLLISVLTSASASTQTTIIPTARTSLSMGAYRALPRSFARIHPKYLTPTVSTIWMGVVSIIFYVGLTLVSQNVLGDSIASVGLMIAFYYGITGFACVWFYRRQLTRSMRSFWMQGVLPGLGGLLLLGAFVKSAYDYSKPDAGSTTLGGVGGVFIIGVGTLVLGALLMIGYALVAPAFFRGRTLVKGTADLVLPGTERDPLFGLPDSGDQSVVIAPDRSNEPPTH